MNNRDQLENKLLYFGYDPECPAAELQTTVRNAVRSQKFDLDGSTLVDETANAFLESIKKELGDINPKKHIVPLSSGMDSRCILSALLASDQIENDSILPITFGSPRTWDYEIGQKIADDLDLDNVVINLSDDSFDWSEDSIRNYASSLDCPTKVFQGYVNSKINDLLDEGSVVWSGHFLDPSVGSHMPKDPSNTWNEACDYFLEHNKYAPELSDSSFTPREILPSEPYLPQNELTYEEQLDFAHRQRCYIRPGVVVDDCRFLTPGTQSAWLEYALNLPRELRTNRKIQIELISQFRPKLLSFPTDLRSGLPPTSGSIQEIVQKIKIKTENKLGMRNVHPGTNYVDFETMLRNDTELRETVQSLFMSSNITKEKGLQHLWEEHLEGRNNTTELMAIASAEAYLGGINDKYQ